MKKTFALLLITLLPTIVFGQSASAEQVKHLATLAPRDIYTAVSGTIAPDGSAFAYLIWEPDVSSQRLWMLDTTSRKSRLLTLAKGLRSQPTWSPDGNLIAFVDSAPERAGLWLVDVRTAKEKRVYQPSAGSVVGASWSADGRLFFSLGNEQTYQLWSIKIDGTEAHEVAKFKSKVSSAVISPDGSRIAFLSFGEGSPQLWVMNTDGSGERRLTSGMNFGEGQYASYKPPVWSPDGLTIYFVAALKPNPFLGAWKISVDVGEPRRIGNINHDITNVSVTRKGAIALTTYEPRLRIATVSSSGGKPRSVLNEPTEDAFLPAWSPDGRSLAYIKGNWQRARWTLNWDIAKVTLGNNGKAATKPRILIAEDNEDYGAVWSPNGKWLAFHSHRNNTDDIYLRAADSFQSPVIALSSVGSNHETSDPAWSPDGRRVVFSSYTNEGQSRLFVVEIDPSTGNPKAEPHTLNLNGFNGEAVSGARFSPDGRTLSFSARLPDGSAALCVAPSNGGQVRTVIKYASDESYGAPEWNHDGRALFFASNDGQGTYRIKRIALKGDAAVTITHGSASAIHPRLSPDGKFLAVTLWDVRAGLLLQAR